MYRVHGISVTTGIGIGKARRIKDKAIFIQDHKINDSEIESNLALFKNSINAVTDEIDDFIKNFDTTEEDKNIIETHKMILLDPDLHTKIENYIKNEKMNIEQAVYTHFNETIDFFKNLDNDLFADRAIDYDDVYKRLIMHLKKIDNSILHEICPGEIVIMNDIPPSLVSQLHKKKIEGIALLKGTKTSHSVIIARALGIPIITGVKYAHKIYNDDLLIIDAKKGIIIGKATDEVLSEYQELKSQINIEAKYLDGFKELTATTADCEQVKIFSNIELPMEIDEILDINTDGVGLFRTEFFYLDKNHLPTEKEQFNEYKMIAQKLGNKKFTIRTIDVGGDKIAGWYTTVKENNPYLGCRGIRFSLKYRKIFITQLRAILRASVFGNVQILFPMIASLEEFLEAKDVLNKCKKDLKKENIAFDDSIKVGTMIEVPSAALYSDILIKHSDFFSIGTNDLLQYVVAVDRNNELMAKYYNPYTPAFLQLVFKTIKSAIRHKKPVSICGELANDKEFTAFLLCMGIRELSVGAEHTLNLKKHIRSIDVRQGIPFLRDLIRCHTIKETEMFIKKINNICINGKNAFTMS